MKCLFIPSWQRTTHIPVPPSSPSWALHQAKWAACARWMLSGIAEGGGWQVLAPGEVPPRHLHPLSLLAQKCTSFSRHEPRLTYNENSKSSSNWLCSQCCTHFIPGMRISSYSFTQQIVIERLLHARVSSRHGFALVEKNPKNKTDLLGLIDTFIVAPSHILN